MTDPQPHITLFNDERYLRCNWRPGQRIFRYDYSMGDRHVGTFSGIVEAAVLESGYSAPFGGVDWARPYETPSVVVDLLLSAIARARSEGVREIRMRARPAYFGENESALEFALLNLGASIETCEFSLGLEPWRHRTPEQYEKGLAGSAPRTLRQGLRRGMEFSSAESAADWAACYELLAETRRRRGARLKISFDYVMRLRGLFGERIAMRRLMLGGELAGAALVYRLSPRWDYVVAWGDDLRHRHDRVINVMAYHLTRMAIAERVDVVDLGVSSVDGVPDDGLIHFKRSIGAVTGLRLNFRLPIG